jgi:hypothetical protein
MSPVLARRPSRDYEYTILSTHLVDLAEGTRVAPEMRSDQRTGARRSGGKKGGGGGGSAARERGRPGRRGSKSVRKRRRGNRREAKITEHK